MSLPVPYTYYTGTYGGTAIEEADWARLSQSASGHIDRFDAIAKVTPLGDAAECRSMATCAMAEALQTWEEAATDGGVRSEHIGSVSVSYSSTAELFPNGLRAGLIDAARPWLHVCLVVQ